ncbi:MAG TPA: DNA internalization-related competence protein ComEC/Rec2 [Bacteroidetes bacterium]|nr:DNA internalization-related competence protein ComEC/Rec2 [Bacteroidota bacterium]
MSKLQEYKFPFARYPGIRNALFLILGIVLASYFDFLLKKEWAFALGCGFMVLLFFEKYSFSPILVQIVNLLHLILVVLFGIMLWTHHSGKTDQVRTLFDGLSGEYVEMSGVLTRVDPLRNGFQSLFIDVDSIRVGPSYFPLKSTLQLRRNTDDVGEHIIFISGEYVELTAEICDFPVMRNPGGFDIPGWLESLGVQGTGMIKVVSDQYPYPKIFSWIWWRTKIEKQLEQSLSDKNIPLTKAILLGNKTELDADLKTDFSRAGLSHLMAVSGMHVGFILMPIWLIIPLFWTSKIGKPVGLLIVIAILFSYAGITGFTSSVSRASITAALLTIGKLFQRNRDAVNTTGVAAIVILLYNPDSLYQIGFQLSFCAVLVILILGPVLRDWIPTRIRFTWKGAIIQFLGISTIVQFGLFPILAMNFGEFSVAGPFANIIGVPVTQTLFLWSLFALPVSFLVPSTVSWIMIPADWLTSILLMLVDFVGNSEIAWIEIRSISPWINLVWIVLIGFLSTLNIQSLRMKWLILTILVFFLIKADQLVQKFGDEELEVVVLDVGQGDAVFITTPSGKRILYDAGIWSPYTNSGRSVILPYLKHRNIDKIDAVILSHPHADHIGGLQTIMHDIEIETIYHSGQFYDSGIYRGYIELASELETPLIDVKAGDMIHVDPSISIMVLHPGIGNYGSNANNWSVAIKLIFGEVSYLFTGDAEEEIEYHLVNEFGDILASKWLKAGHHGSKSSSTDTFLDVVNPEHVAVSVGYRNRYRHPHLEATNQLVRTGAKIKYTSLDGGLVYKSDGKSIYFVK